MTSVYTVRGVATQVFYFSLVAMAFIFVAMLVTGVHP